MQSVLGELPFRYKAGKVGTRAPYFVLALGRSGVVTNNIIRKNEGNLI